MMALREGKRSDSYSFDAAQSQQVEMGFKKMWKDIFRFGYQMMGRPGFV
jgi:hypothetical protein